MSVARCPGQEGRGGGLTSKASPTEGPGEGSSITAAAPASAPARCPVGDRAVDTNTMVAGRPIAVPARQVRIGVLIDAPGKSTPQIPPEDRIGGLFHDVAPMAPHRFEIENTKRFSAVARNSRSQVHDRRAKASERNGESELREFIHSFMTSPRRIVGGSPVRPNGSVWMSRT